MKSENVVSTSRDTGAIRHLKIIVLRCLQHEVLPLNKWNLINLPTNIFPHANLACALIFSFWASMFKWVFELWNANRSLPSAPSLICIIHSSSSGSIQPGRNSASGFETLQWAASKLWNITNTVELSRCLNIALLRLLSFLRKLKWRNIAKYENKNQ